MSDDSSWSLSGAILSQMFRSYPSTYRYARRVIAPRNSLDRIMIASGAGGLVLMSKTASALERYAARANGMSVAEYRVKQRADERAAVGKVASMATKYARRISR